MLRMTLVLALCCAPLCAQSYPNDEASLRSLVTVMVDNVVATKGEALDRHESKALTDSITSELSVRLQNHPDPSVLPPDFSRYLRCGEARHSAVERREHLGACADCHALTSTLLRGTRIRPVQKRFRIHEVTLDDGFRYRVRRDALYQIRVLPCGTEIVARSSRFELSYSQGWIARDGACTQRVSKLVCTTR